MNNFSSITLGVRPLSDEEVVGCVGGFSWMQTFVNIVANEIVRYAPEIYESAQATKRTFAAHPEIFVK